MPLPIDPTTRSVFSPWLALVAAVVALFIYLGVLDNELQYDGRQLTILNGQVVQPSSLRQIWLEPIPAQSAGPAYRPILAAFLRIQFKSWGYSPSSFHSVNLILLVALLLLYQALVGRLSRHMGLTIVAGMTLALHPMASQAVRGVAGQGLLLALLASLGAAYLLQWYREGGIGRTVAVVSIAMCGALAMGSHELGMILPVWLGIQWWLVRLREGM